MTRTELLRLILLSIQKSVLEESETAKTKDNEFYSTVWNWVRPALIKDESVLRDLKEAPDDELNRQGVMLTVQKYLRSNPELEERIIKLASESKVSTFNQVFQGNSVNQIHFGSGDNIGNDKMIIDITIDEINRELDNKD